MAGTFRVVTFAGLVAFLALSGHGRARQDPTPPPSAQTPTFRAGINVVRVDVVATATDGSQVSDLTADDFDITEGGKRQKIDTFKLVSIDPDGPEGAPVSISSDAVEEEEAKRDDIRMFAIFLDDYHVSEASGRVVSDQLARFVETELGPSDLVGLMYPLTSLDSVRMTRNRQSVAIDIRKFAGRRGNFTPRNIFEENAAYATNNPSRMRREVTFSALKGLIMRMGGMKEGRKVLMLISEGYGTSTEVNKELKEIADLASRNNTAIYPVSPRLYIEASARSLPVDLADGINVLAEQSGGRLVMETARDLAALRERRAAIGTPKSNLAGAMKQILVDSTGYYLLGYSSTLLVPDGKFHKIEVKVRRRDVQLRYRKGYFAWRPEDVAPTVPARPSAPASVVSTTLAMTATPRGRPVRTWIGMARGTSGLTRVTLLWEPLPGLPGGAIRDVDRPARVALKATGPDEVSYFDGWVPADIADSPSGSHVAFEAPPGTIKLRASVESAAGTVLDTEVRNITVADLTGSHMTMGTPEVFRARTLAEFQHLKTIATRTPVATREFSRTERLLINVPVYGAGAAAPLVSARLLNRLGQPMAQLPASPGEPADGRFEVEVGLASVAAGDYGVELTASGETGTATEIVAFRVTN